MPTLFRVISTFRGTHVEPGKDTKKVQVYILVPFLLRESLSLLFYFYIYSELGVLSISSGNANGSAYPQHGPRGDAVQATQFADRCPVALRDGTQSISALYTVITHLTRYKLIGTPGRRCCTRSHTTTVTAGRTAGNYYATTAVRLLVTGVSHQVLIAMGHLILEIDDEIWVNGLPRKRVSNAGATQTSGRIACQTDGLSRKDEIVLINQKFRKVP